MLRLPRPHTALWYPTLLAAAVILALTAPPGPTVLARGGRDKGLGDDHVRVAGVCAAGTASRLELRDRGDSIAIRFDVHGRRAREVWRVTLVHERRVVWRGHVRTRPGSGSLRVARSVGDLPGADRVFARAVGPRGLACLATAALSG